MRASAANVRAIRFERWPWETSPGLLVRFAAAVTTVFLLFAPYLANLSRDYTRYSYFWRTADTLCVGLLLLGAAVVATLTGELVRRTGNPTLVRIFNHLFLAVFGVGILANLKFAVPQIPLLHWQLTTAQIQTAWIVLALLVGYSFGRPQSRSVLRCRQCCQVLLPVVPVTFVSLLCSSTYPADIEPITPIPQSCSASLSGNSSGRGGIYVFIFDEWSYERTFANSQPLPLYAHLADFAKTATVYHQAHSPAPDTEASIPAMLMQTRDAVVIKNGRLGFSDADGKYRPARDCTSVFSRLKPLGYHTAMIGTYMPYRLWLGDQVDVCRTYRMYPSGCDLWSSLGIHAFNAMHYSPDPWTKRGYKQLETRLLYGMHCDTLDNTHNDIRMIIRAWPSNTFAVAHIFLPHMPAALKPDLTFNDFRQAGWREGDLGYYQANLTAMDAMLGDFVSALRQAGKYDDATIILTSDHAWRKDPDWANGLLTGPKTHVPLLVKVPRQDRPASVTERFETKDIGELIESIVSHPGMGDVLVTENRIR